MDAIFKFPSSEFNEDLYKKLSFFLKDKKADITIAVREGSSIDITESNIGFWNSLNDSIKDLEAGRGTKFTMEELEKFIDN